MLVDARRGEAVQVAPATRTVTLPPGELRVFLDCQYECDFDYLRKEITFVDHVRDSQSADIHALITTETTGGGGWNCWRAGARLVVCTGSPRRDQ